MSKNKKIILVANSEHVFDINAHIHSEDLIVRFNLPLISTLEKTSQRTDLLFLANSVDIVQKKLRKNSKFIQFLQRQNNHQDLKIFFPYSDDLIKINKPYYKKKTFIFFKQLMPNFNNTQYISFLNQQGFSNIEILKDHYYLDLKKKISPNSEKIISTGVIASYFFLNHPSYQDFDLYLHGFTFEGWNGHDWEEEEKFIHDHITMNKIHTFEKQDTIKNL